MLKVSVVRISRSFMVGVFVFEKWFCGLLLWIGWFFFCLWCKRLISGCLNRKLKISVVKKVLFV